MSIVEKMTAVEKMKIIKKKLPFYKKNCSLIDQQYYSNGTFVNGHRLSKAKMESEPKEIGHGSVLQIGATKLLCHVHPGRETCFECEPGLIQVSMP